MWEAIKFSLIATIGQYLLTSLHHAYGAWIYDTPWRLHALYPGMAILLAAVAFFLLYRRLDRKVFLMLYLAVAGIVFGLAVGIYEGGYNHLLKNLLFFAGVDRQTILSFYFSSLTELPNDAFFEITGVAQLGVGVVQLYYIARVVQMLRSVRPA